MHLNELLQLIFIPRFDYNTLLVICGVIIYSIGSVLIGNFIILQKRSLLADVLSHATFPGVTAIFILMIIFNTEQLSKNLLVLLLGAFASTLFAICLVRFLSQHTKLKQDAIQATVLGLFFGAGVAFLGLAQRLPIGSTAGMFSFIYGKTASMQMQDAFLFSFSALCIITLLLFKKRQMSVLCFDPEFAYTIGINSKKLDLTILLMVILQVIIGIQAIGLLMVSAMFIIPVVISKFWSERLNSQICVSVVISIVSGYIGSIISANVVNFPTGALIVTVMEAFFIASVLFGTKRGILIKCIQMRAFHYKIKIEHILRTLYEMQLDKIKSDAKDKAEYNTQLVSIQEFCETSHYSLRELQAKLRYMQRKQYLVFLGNMLELTDKGIAYSERIIRNHNLWEAYLLHYTDASLEYVDYSADKVEHVLGQSLTLELEHLLAQGDSKPRKKMTQVPLRVHKNSVQGELR